MRHWYIYIILYIICIDEWYIYKYISKYYMDTFLSVNSHTNINMYVYVYMSYVYVISRCIYICYICINMVGMGLFM